MFMEFVGTKLYLNFAYKDGEHEMGAVNSGRPKSFQSFGPGIMTLCSSLGGSGVMAFFSVSPEPPTFSPTSQFSRVFC